MEHDKLGAKESINKMSFAALALAEVMLDLLDKAHAEKPEAGYDKRKAKMQQLIAELKFYTEEE
ncbi:hypothetical protein PR1_80 [Providencia phage vB_PreS_PR1]|uniref:Cell division protein ZapA n=1 Tax=Providencia phage vB_PreS_PR1 TaxID=1931407 RepID=A0A1S6KV88_9CAUD|nr:hypothetical protein FDH30_gp135 [Providencia phage vB_PreS_PR1]AQT25350.1 hypothetical protein PR1_80 [Providencia phage vB_PreS_PR1]